MPPTTTTTATTVLVTIAAVFFSQNDFLASASAFLASASAFSAAMPAGVIKVPAWRPNAPLDLAGPLHDNLGLRYSGCLEDIPPPQLGSPQINVEIRKYDEFWPITTSSPETTKLDVPAIGVGRLHFGMRRTRVTFTAVTGDPPEGRKTPFFSPTSSGCAKKQASLDAYSLTWMMCVGGAIESRSAESEYQRLLLAALAASSNDGTLL
ncbi:hypothetical protein BC831DRAFT_444285 [Entophlyctis helioformis]|nr:hypothetical protein BC831DRAFT_444285 [Entophlyctis helioformis]